MPRTALLFVVARDEPERYEYLQRAFASDHQVGVVLDRRQADRRSSNGQANGRVAVRADRRKLQRRTRDNRHELARLGYALIRLNP